MKKRVKVIIMISLMLTIASLFPSISQSNSITPHIYQFFAIWIGIGVIVYSLSHVFMTWDNFYESHLHNREYGHDSYGEILNAGDVVSIESVIEEGVSNCESKIFLHKGYLMCLHVDGEIHKLKFYHTHSTLNKIKKIKK